MSSYKQQIKAFKLQIKEYERVNSSKKENEDNGVAVAAAVDGGKAAGSGKSKRRDSKEAK
jgi:hypothetical protein